MYYSVQKGKLNGNYKEFYDSDEEKRAWGVYHKTTLERGEKKRIQEITTLENGETQKRTLTGYRRYWTQGHGER